MIDIDKALDNLYTLVSDEWELDESKKPNLNGSQRLELFADVRQTLNDLQQKETPMKPLNGDMCPNCKKPLFGEEDSYCPQCGKHIDWSKE